MARWLRPIPISDRDRLLQGIKVTHFNTSCMYHLANGCGNADGYDFSWQWGVPRVVPRRYLFIRPRVRLRAELCEILAPSISAISSFRAGLTVRAHYARRVIAELAFR